jgi:hypothetical protein
VLTIGLMISDVELQKGYLFAVPESPSDFKVEAGDGTLKTYTFGNGVAEHKVSRLHAGLEKQTSYTDSFVYMWLWRLGRST